MVDVRTGPALPHLNQGAATVSQVGHDARTSLSNNVVAEADRGSFQQNEESSNKKRLTGEKKYVETTAGRHTHNRESFCARTTTQAGARTRSGAFWCSDCPEHVHICDKCLGSHISSKGAHQKMPQTYWSKKAQKEKGQGTGMHGLVDTERSGQCGLVGRPARHEEDG